MKYFLYIVGCQMNESDAERLSGILRAYGCTETDDERSADVIIVFACSVRQKAVDKIFGKLERWRSWQRDKKIRTVLTGCVLPDDRKKFRERFDILIRTHEMHRLPRLLGLTADKPAEAITNADYLAFDPHRASPLIAHVPVMTGCNNYCTYCAVPYTRGEEASRPSADIIAEVRGLIAAEYREIMLLGQNVNAYIDPEAPHDPELIESRARAQWKFDRDQPIQFRAATTDVPKDFAQLLIKLNRLKGNFWMRFLTSNPQDISDELIAALPKCKKVTPYLHLPIQSGDDEILRRMNRRHTREYYLGLIDKIRSAWPGVAITTDVIVGFPGETEEQFQHTADLMAAVRYDMAYIAEYSPRPGTAAARFFEDDVPRTEKKRRKQILNTLLEKTALQKNRELIGNEVAVLVESYDAQKKENVGKTDTYKSIRFRGKNATGTFVRVTVTKASPWGLAGKRKQAAVSTERTQSSLS
ncbi:MAG: MiaB/RimO family radical SAM methylthiotransferase [Patescibacteria group bacterium]